MTLSLTHTKATSSLTLSYRARANALLCFPQQERENNAVYYSRTNFLFLGKSDERDRTNEIKTRANFNAREERAERERERERERGRRASQNAQKKKKKRKYKCHPTKKKRKSETATRPNFSPVWTIWGSRYHRTPRRERFARTSTNRERLRK